MNKSLADIKWALRAHYHSFTMQVVNGLACVSAIDSRDNGVYVVYTCMPDKFNW